MAPRTSLSEKMHALADAGHARAAALRDTATAFDIGLTGFYAEPQTVDVASFMGRWARARRVWAECSGEPLL